MSEPSMPATTETTDTSAAEAVAQTQDRQTETTDEQRPKRPSGIPQKFWDSEVGSVRADALLQSYLELERKLGSMVALPSDEDDREGRGRLERALGVPKGPEDYNIESRSDFLEASPEVNARLHAAGFTPQQAQLVYDLAAEHLVPILDDALDEFSTTQECERLASRFGGDDAWKKMAAQIKTWGSANLSQEVFQTLSTSYDGVMSMHQMMQAREPEVLGESQGDQAVPSATSLSQLMRDPRYWRDRDPDLIAKVTHGFRQLYPK